jgi:hypothetical protein
LELRVNLGNKTSPKVIKRELDESWKPILKNSEYQTTPAFDTLRQLDEHQLSKVSNFTVRNKNSDISFL